MDLLELHRTAGKDSIKSNLQRPATRTHRDRMDKPLFQLNPGLITSFCHSYFLSPLTNPPGFIADVASLLEIMVQAKRLVSYRLQTLGNTNGKLHKRGARMTNGERAGPLKMLGL